MDLEQRKSDLIAAIHAAWADAEYPGDSNILSDFPDLDAIDGTPYMDYEIPDLRDLLRGRTWQEAIQPLADSYAKEYIQRVTPEAYRYFMPALLLDVLNPEAGEYRYASDEFLGSLSPLWWHYNTEHDFIVRMEHLSSEQIGVVREFLGYLNYHSTDDRNDWVKAYRPAWDTTAGHQQSPENNFWADPQTWIDHARALEERFTRRRPTLLSDIEAAWDGAERPDDSNILPWPESDYDTDDLEMLAFVKGRTWRQVAPLLFNDPASVCVQPTWFAPQAYRYFMAAYLTAIVKSAEYPFKIDEHAYDFLNSLLPTDHVYETITAFLSFMEPLSPHQKKVVLDVIQLLPRRLWEEDALSFWPDPDTWIRRAHEKREQEIGEWETRKPALRAAIHAAWADAEYPGDSNIVPDYSIPPGITRKLVVNQKAVEMEKLLRGKTWQEATPLLAGSYLKDYFHLLTPEAYRYYMASLLESILDDEAGNYSGTLEENLNRTWRYYGSEFGFVSVMERLTTEQISVVKDFMLAQSEVALANATERRHGIVPETERERRQMHFEFDFWIHPQKWIERARRRRESYAQLKPQIENEIRAAWADAEYPGDSDLTGGQESEFESKHVLMRSLLQGKTWQDLVPLLETPLYKYDVWITSFTPNACLYYMAAYLIAILNSETYPIFPSNGHHSFESSLHLSDRSYHSPEEFLSYMQPLTPQQKKAVQRVVSLLSHEDWQPDDLEFWNDPDPWIDVGTPTDT